MKAEERELRINDLFDSLEQELWEHLYVCGDPCRTVDIVKRLCERLNTVRGEMNCTDRTG